MKLIKLKCEACGAILKVNEDLKKVSCNYCGAEFLLDNDIKKVEITKNINHHKIYTDEAKIKELEYKKRESIINFAWCGVAIIIFLLLFRILYFIDEPNKNEIKIPMNSEKYEGENFEVVIKQLEDVGFENIESKPMDDLVTGWVTKDGEAESISIAGDTEFAEGDIFSKDSEVIVTYHTFKKKK